MVVLKSHETFCEELKAAARGEALRDLFDFMEENIECFFSTPYISDYYKLIRDADMSVSKIMLPKLIKAWLAFLCGDNAVFYPIMKGIDELELKGYYESSFYYALKALAGVSADYQERLKYGKLSIDILPEGDSSIYIANAKLTYAQILAGMDQYRAAAEMFQDSYSIFYSRDMHFPAVVALVNSLLNRYRLGEFGAVIDECCRTLIMSASFRKEVQEYWNILNLPLGMCYYEMNKPSLAIEYLKKAKHIIDKMNLFHMHGIIELYLFKSCYLLNDRAGMEEIKAQALADFENMHYSYIDLIISMFRILSGRLNGGQNLQADIERFEIEFIKSKGTNQFLLLETLCYLKINGLSEVITIEDIIKSLERFRFIGMIPYTQMLLVLLAEMYFIENRPGNAAECLKEAVTIYREYGICASFYLYPLKSSILLEKIEPRIYSGISKKGAANKLPVQGQILSAREKEIMQLIALGKSNKEISEVLYIGIGTIKWHINHIFSKLEAENRVQAIQKAKSLGEIQ